MAFSLLCLACTLFFGAFLFLQVSADVQIFKVCYAVRCTGDDYELFRSSVRNFSRFIPKGKTVYGYCSKFGSVWTAYEDPEYDELVHVNLSTPSTHKRQTLDHVSGNSCEMSNSIKLGSFRHVAKAETHMSALSLYLQTKFSGPELYFEGDTLQLPQPISFQSSCFTGIDRWELYRGKEFDGESTCLQTNMPDDPAGRSPVCNNGLAHYDEFAELYSFRRGCLYSRSTDRRIHPEGATLPKQHTQSAPWLSLYTDKDRSGKKLHIDGTQLRLPFVYNFASFEMKGTWQTFTGRYFDGNSTCINAFTKKNFTDEGGSIDVGSIKLGCGHLVENLSDGNEDKRTNSGFMVKIWDVLQYVLLAAIYKFQ